MPATKQFKAPANATIAFTPDYLEFLNEKLSKLPPQKILEWAIVTIPNLYQTTAFGLTGCVILDMISQISQDQPGDDHSHLIPLIFIDTLYHFKETLELAQRCVDRYNVDLLVYKPLHTDTVEEFEVTHGERLWETDEDAYDYLVKVEPARRAYEELGVQAVITGRRRSQGNDRAAIPVIEVDSTGLIKINPLAYWDFAQVRAYGKANEVPYNTLIDVGYKSIGDWHSTKKPDVNGDERSGRWEGKQKSECGLHEDYFKMRRAYMEAKNRREARENKTQSNDLVSQSVQASA